MRCVVPARDGYPLTAIVHGEPGSGPPVLLAPASAIPAGFYRRFAEHLAASGFVAIRFDYRGIGASKPERMRGFKCTLETWATKDLAGMIDWCEAVGHGRPHVVAHSLSCRLLLSAPNAARARHVALIAGHSGGQHTSDSRRGLVRAAGALALPCVDLILGRVPASLWGSQGETLPVGVVRDWLTHDLPVTREMAAVLAEPVLALGIEGDRQAPAEAVKALSDLFPADVVRHYVLPRQHGEYGELNHFNFFRADQGQSLWPALSTWLRSPHDSELARFAHTARVPSTPARRSDSRAPTSSAASFAG